jgi:hypothetical protein
MVHTGVAWPYSACRSGSGLNEGLGLTALRRNASGDRSVSVERRNDEKKDWKGVIGYPSFGSCWRCDKVKPLRNVPTLTVQIVKGGHSICKPEKKHYRHMVECTREQKYGYVDC